MALLNLYSRLHFDDSRFTAGMRRTKSQSSNWGRSVRRNLLYAFGITGGGALVGMGVRGMVRFARDLSKSREEMERLGVSIDQGLIDKWDEADTKIQQSIAHIKAGLIPAMIAVANQFAVIVQQFEVMLAGVPPWLGKLVTLVWQIENAKLNRAMGNIEQVTGAVLGTGDAMQAKKDEQASREVGKEEIADAIVRQKFASNNVRASDSLAAVGGFTSAADKEMKTIQQNQLRELEDISKNTKVSITS